MTVDVTNRMLGAVQWKAEPRPADAQATADGVPYVTHSGTFTFMGMSLRVYRLSDGRAIVNADDLAKFLPPGDP